MIIKRGKNIWHRGKRGIRSVTASALRALGHHPSSSRKLRQLLAVNILHINLTGLGTDPKGHCNGMREQSDVFQAMYPESDAVFMSHADIDRNPLQVCEQIVKLINAGNAAGKYTHVIIRGHSFGGAALMFLLNWLAKQNISISLAIFYDPVPNPILGQRGAWTLPKSAPTESLCFVQTYGQAWWLVFPCGTPVTGAKSINVSKWKKPVLFHSSMISDPRVWDLSLRAMRNAVADVSLRV